MSARKYPTSTTPAGPSRPPASPEQAEARHPERRPYSPPEVNVFPVADLVRSGGGSATDAFGQGHF